ncbi:carboxypeptidase regulatory-like domain-containing protein [Halobellus ruber]|uniref:Carboxypeptidase regulatory-like domain-containing protein n=1 Tax=Halobellus ruber TaxID=2761102 RepID=A0A7J9SJZ7_9EURY|nr:carboxypeptidase regulatory-like domain-containing protein [Halobellus ruber]MBB6647280.1 carboxypeptidase regulatory-like domain-containing protein [Halobellus ruber]
MSRGATARRAVLLLAALVCVSALGTGVVAAENVTISNPTEGEVGDHTWNTTASSSGTLDHLVINYTGTGADLSEKPAFIDGNEITVNGQTVAINGSEYSITSTTINATLETSASISGGDRIEFVLENVRNPSSTGTNSATVELNNSSSQFSSSTESFDIVRGGYVNGTVKNGTGVLTSASVSIYNTSTGDFVTGYGINPSTDQYSAHIADGTYRFDYTATGYTTVSKIMEINTSESKNDINATLAKKGYINGTVTDSDGNGIGGINLVADPKSGSGAQKNTTAADGSFSFYVAPGKYDLVAFNNPDYEFNINPDVSATSDSTTTTTVSLSEVPDKGTITGRLVDGNGNGVSGKRVSASDTSYQYYNSTVTNATGYFSMRVPQATYRIRTNSTPTVRESGVSVTANELSSVELTVPEKAYLSGTVSNASGPIPKATVIADSGDSIHVNRSTDASGNYNITVPPGEYAVTVLVPGQTANTKTATVTAGNTNTTDFTAEQTAVTSKSVSIIDGPGNDANLGTKAVVRGGLLQVQLINTSPSNNAPKGAPQELEGMGATDETKFEINLTVTNFSADSLLWAIEDAEFSTTPSSKNPDATNVTITGNATTLQANTTSANVGPLLNQDPSDVQWPTDRADQANYGVNQTVYVGIFDFSSTPGRIEDSLNGASVTTNAQRFSAPSVRNQTLRIWVGAPSKTVEGADHDGFYQATIPDSQLNEWGVDDPESELQTFYKGSQADFTVEETGNGARVVLDNISYSAGFVEVEANPTSDSGNGGGGSDSGPADTSATASVAGDRVQLAVDNVRAGTPVSVDVPGSSAMEQSGVRMQSVELRLRFSGDTSLDIATSATPSQPTPAGTTALFAYEVSTNLADADIDRATVRVTVDSDRVADPEAVRALRRSGDGWDPVTTNLRGTTNDEYVYTIETTEFSEFALVAETGSDATDTATATAEPTPTPTAEATPTAKSSPTPTTTSTTQPGFGVVVAVAALLSSAVLARRRI